MKKLIQILSIILVLCVILGTTPVVFAADAAPTFKFNKAGGTMTQVSGTHGKSSEDTYDLIKVSTTTGKALYGISNIPAMPADGYVIYECDFLPLDENLNYIWLSKESSNRIGKIIKGNWELERWNHLMIAIAPDSTLTVKINGSDASLGTAGDGSYADLSRIYFGYTNASSGEYPEAVVGVDNQTMYASTVIPTYAVPSLTGTKDGKFIEKTPISTINSSNTGKTIRVYSDEYTTLKTTGSLAVTDRVVVEDNGIIYYFSVDTATAPALVGARNGRFIQGTAISTINSKNTGKTIRVYSDEYTTLKTAGNLAVTDRIVVEENGIIYYDYGVDASAVCSEASDVNSKSSYTFDDFTTGPVVEGYMGMNYEFDRNSGEMEICQEGVNRYLRINKRTTGRSLSWRKDFSKVNGKWIDYVVEFRFRIAEDCAENSSFVIQEQNDEETGGSLYVTLFDNGSVQYRDRSSGTAVDTIKENVYEKGEFNSFKAVLHRSAGGADSAGESADLYINGELVKSNMPCAEKSGFKKLYIILNKSTTGYIDIDDLRMYNLADSFTAKTVRVEDSIITGYKGCTAESFAGTAITLDEGARIEFFNNAIPVTGSTPLAEGMTAKVTNADGSYKSYTLGIAESVITINHTFNSYPTADRFDVGKVKVTLDVDCAEPERSVSLIVAQKDISDNCLIQAATNERIFTADGELSAELTTTVAEGTYIEIFVMDSVATLKPLKNTSKKLMPYSAEDDANIEGYFFPGYKTKAVTMSWDDGNDKADTALMEALGEIPATFNLIARNVEGAINSNPDYIKKYMDDGSEIANHSYSHKDLRDNGDANRNDDGVMTEDTVISDEIRQGTAVLNEVLDSNNKIAGFVWPYAQANRTAVMAYLRDNDDWDYVYVRDSNTTHKYNLPKDFYDWEFTVIEKDAAAYYPGFINDPTNELQLFSIWGHPNFLYTQQDSSGNPYMSIAEFESSAIEPIIRDKDKLWIAVNRDVAKYIKAIDEDNGRIMANGQTISNTSDVDVYLRVNGKNVTIEAGKTYTVSE